MSGFPWRKAAIRHFKQQQHLARGTCRSHSSRITKSYNDAIAALNTLQTNAQTVNALRRSGSIDQTNAIPQMVEYVKKIGYQPSDLDCLNCIHIAGTKGKGSTSAFISSILSEYQHIKKIGLYTSPHLRFVRERIQINNAPISEDLFTKYFYDIWNRLEDAAADDTSGLPARPVYFRFLTLMAFHVYLSEGVDTAVIECGIGGEHDSTNVIVQPSVTGITSLGIDHTILLGDTIESIAWHKAGIMKPGAPCFSAPQAPSAVEVMKDRAREKGTSLSVVEQDSQLNNLRLNLAAPFQQINASLAVAVASAHLKKLGVHDDGPDLPVEVIRGLESAHFPGRCDKRSDTVAPLTWYIDAAHTVESLTAGTSWFRSQLTIENANADDPAIRPPQKTILLFNQATRTVEPLLRAIFNALNDNTKMQHHIFTHMVFCSNKTFRSGFREELKSLNNYDPNVEDYELLLQHEMRNIWRKLQVENGQKGAESTDIVVRGSIEEATEWCREVAQDTVAPSDSVVEEAEKLMDTRVFVTGSVHLVGGFLEVLETEEEREEASKKDGE